jgi:hypothetical protein
MFRSLVPSLCLMATLTWTATSPAGGHCQGAAGCGCHVECPRCHYYCKLEVEKEKEKNYCWDVECEPVCIPRVQFPWECGCPPKCAKVRQVRVLKKVEYECERCTYTWTPVECGCENGCSAGCHTGCATAPQAMPTDEQPVPPVAEPVEASVQDRVAPEPETSRGQRFTWFQSARSRTSESVALPVRLLRAARERQDHK